MDQDRSRPRAEIERALEYQLNERLYFIREEDPVMCDLFAEAARYTESVDKRTFFIAQAHAYGRERDWERENRWGVRR